MRKTGMAAIVGIAVSGCVVPSTPSPVGHYAARIAAPMSIPAKYDTVVSTAGEGDLNDHSKSSVDRGDEVEALLDQPISLEQAEELALQKSPKVIEANRFAFVAKSREDVAYSAFLPTISASYAVQGFSSSTGYAGVPTGGRFPVLPIRGYGPGTQDFEVVDLRVQWTVFQFGKRLALHDQAEMRAEIACWQSERTKQSVLFDVALNYARVLQTRATRVVAERAVDRAEATLKDVKSLAANGVLTREDVLRADVFLADVRQDLISATSEAYIAVAGLNRSIGINVSLPTRVIERAIELDEYMVPLEESLSQAINSRPEFCIVRLGVAAAGRGADATRADFLPTISTSGGGALVEGARVQNS